MKIKTQAKDTFSYSKNRLPSERCLDFFLRKGKYSECLLQPWDNCEYSPSKKMPYSHHGDKKHKLTWNLSPFWIQFCGLIYQIDLTTISSSSWPTVDNVSVLSTLSYLWYFISANEFCDDLTCFPFSSCPSLEILFTYLGERKLNEINWGGGMKICISG